MSSEEWLTAAEAAKYLKVSKPTIYRLSAEGRLPFFTIAGRGDRRYKRTDLDAVLEPGQEGKEAA